MLFNLKNTYMFLNKIYEEFSLNKVLTFDFKSNKNYRLNIIKEKELTYINSYTLDSSFYSNDIESKFPSSALKIELEKGSYILSYDKGSILNNDTNKLNDCIMSSRGEIILDEISLLNDSDISSLAQNDLIPNEKLSKDEKSLLSYFEFKVTSNKKFYIWVTKENVKGAIQFSIHRIDDERDLNLQEQTMLLNSFDKNVTLKNNSLYKFELYEVDASFESDPIKKYPIGTYQITLNNIVSKNVNGKSIETIIENDKASFNMNDGKIINTTNITIPPDVNPMNYYSMISKIEILVLIDFNTDTIYFYPCANCEVFLSIYIPPAKEELIEEAETYQIIKLTRYDFIHSTYSEKEKIIENLKEIITFDNKALNIDEYELYYWISNFSLKDDYVKEIEKLLTKYFIYVKLNIQGFVIDDVSETISSDDIVLETEINSCRFNIVDEPTSHLNDNYVIWSEPSSWSNYNNIKNKLSAIINGTCILKISKQHFKNATGFDLNEISEGFINNQSFKKLNLNYPIIHPFERFQYWLAHKNI